MKNHQRLFTPLKFNSIMMQNRIMASPMDLVDHRMISSDYIGGISLADKSLGGAAIVYIAYVNGEDPKTGVFAKYNREKTREQIYIIKQAGSKAGVEVPFHGPSAGNGRVFGPMSELRYDGVKMRAMTPADMKAFFESVGAYCKELKDFGFDTILLHFGHDSLCSQFLSPGFNRREDEYGGSLENRMRFPKEALICIREYVGPDYPLQIRLSRELMVPESYQPEDMLAFIHAIEPYVDMVNISTGMDTYGGTYNRYIANIHSTTPSLFPHMYSLAFAEQVKQECDVLVSIVGAVTDPDEAEEALKAGKIDAVMLGRQLVADPFWPKKVKNEQSEDIVPCIRCNNCFHFTTEHKNIVCSVNPRFRRENRVSLKLTHSDVTKKVVVIGGGPAGMKTAITASERGHDVILLEKSDKLGGKINSSDYDARKIDLRRYRDYLLRQTEKSAVDVRLNTEATPELVRSLNPDALVIAVGAEPIMPKIKGIHSPNVFNVMAFYEKQIEVTGNVTIIGGGTVGCELALELADKAEKVTIIEMGSELAAKGNLTYKLALDYFMKPFNNIETLMNSRCEEISERFASILDKDNNQKIIQTDMVINATGFRPDRELVESFYGIVPDTHIVGDCESVGTVCEATNYGYFIGANL
jgi:2,4-dienoyl-CoA reductase-like NADH-dependent reductase (Old Yellow Enzyme family)/thioredoxin reductase